jgi:hypothetical protein
VFDGECRVSSGPEIPKIDEGDGGRERVNQEAVYHHPRGRHEGGLCNPRLLYSGGNQVPNIRNNESDARTDGRYQLGLAPNRLPPPRIQM